MVQLWALVMQKINVKGLLQMNPKPPLTSQISGEGQGSSSELTHCHAGTRINWRPNSWTDRRPEWRDHSITHWGAHGGSNGRSIQSHLHFMAHWWTNWRPHRGPHPHRNLDVDKVLILPRNPVVVVILVIIRIHFWFWAQRNKQQG